MPCHMVAFQSGPCSNFAFCWPHSCSAICMQAKPRPQHCNQSVSLTTGKSHLRHLKLEVPCCQFPMVRLPQHQFFMLLGPCPALVLHSDLTVVLHASQTPQWHRRVVLHAVLDARAQLPSHWGPTVMLVWSKRHCVMCMQARHQN